MAPVKEPKNFGVPGKKVTISEPASNGTIIMPPGTRSMLFLMGICVTGTFLDQNFILIPETVKIVLSSRPVAIQKAHEKAMLEQKTLDEPPLQFAKAAVPVSGQTSEEACSDSYPAGAPSDAASWVECG